jgi:hypothetical protein
MAFMASCIHITHAYYQSPFQTNTSDYKTIPTHTDSARSALYASGVFTIGTANDRWRDGTGGFIGSIYRSYTSKYLQGYCGFTGMIGGYHVKAYPIDTFTYAAAYRENLNLDDSLINSLAGSKIWGGLGLTGGINFSLPFHKHEWRVIELEGSLLREFGQYRDFRQKLPDTSANLIDRSKLYFTLSIGTDLVFYIRNGQVGYKAAAVFSTRNLHGFYKDRQPFTRTSGYFSQTLHLTIKKVTGFSQLNFGTWAMSYQLGMSYRLGR